MFFSKYVFLLFIQIYVVICSSIKSKGTIITWDFGNLIVPGNKSLSYDLTILSPTMLGNYGVIIFLAGLGNPFYYY